MEPAIHRGDLLLLSNRYSTPLVSGDIVVYKLPGRDVPIVHRIIKVHEEHGTAAVDVLTKGDNNLPDDRELYGDRKWLTREMVVGRAFAFLPRAGMVRWFVWLGMVVCALFCVPREPRLCPFLWRRRWESLLRPFVGGGGLRGVSAGPVVTYHAVPVRALARDACWKGMGCHVCAFSLPELVPSRSRHPGYLFLTRVLSTSIVLIVGFCCTRLI